MSKTVFNFFDPLYQPQGPLSAVGLVAPEAQLGTGPYVVGFLNDMSDRIRGTKSAWEYGGACTYEAAGGGSDAAAAVDELSLLLTAGRLNAEARGVIVSRYQQLFDSSGAAAALQMAQELFLFTAEFHATNLNVLRHVPRVFVPPAPSQGRAYKAIVYLYLNGGADTYNLLMPHTCGTNPSGCAPPTSSH